MLETFNPVTRPESLAIVSVNCVLLALLDCVIDVTSNSSSWTKLLPLLLSNTTVYTWSFVNVNVPVVLATNSILFLSITLLIGPEALDLDPVTFSPY